MYFILYLCATHFSSPLGSLKTWSAEKLSYVWIHNIPYGHNMHGYTSLNGDHWCGMVIRAIYPHHIKKTEMTGTFSPRVSDVFRISDTQWSQSGASCGVCHWMASYHNLRLSAQIHPPPAGACIVRFLKTTRLSCSHINGLSSGIYTCRKLGQNGYGHLSLLTSPMAKE